ncbi:MAG: pantoate--beta-alanine ligase [Gammaproteobacteria bacterium]|nr:pantoate--beta-alanine ligase [Gammaproteobacteria bacterium]
MQTVKTITEVRARIALWRSQGQRIAFVPTMGNLHDGHMRLVQQAGQLADRVVASVFVNPMQFGASEDLASYPRTLAEDGVKLAENGTHLLFVPDASEMYSRGIGGATRVEVPGLSDILCGAYRPGHFVGVSTVVSMLFNIVQPDMALFGEKDYQQLLVIRRMVADLCIPVQVLGVPTVRESDGLAMSSRNSYLSAEERARAPCLYRALCQARDRMSSGGADYTAVEAEGMQALSEAGFRVDYFSVRRAEDLAAPLPEDRALVILAAAWLGKARLIDNMALELTGN